MKVGFAGTPAFAAHILLSLVDADWPVSLVLTQPDRPRGRGQKVAPSPVKELARERAIPVYQPPTLATDPAQTEVAARALDVLVVAAYGLILPPAVLGWPRHGCINVHASLLPRWRGAAPIQRALLAGDTETGITLMQMDAGLDTGPMLDVARLSVDARETAGSLELKLAALGARMLSVYLRRLAAGEPGASTPQPEDGATYASKIRKDEAEIDWTAPAAAIDRQVRAFDPTPGATTLWSGERVKVWRAQPAPDPARDAVPGTVLAIERASVVVACGEGALGLAELQPAGGRRMSAGAFAAGRGLGSGARFGASVQ
ncbi:MAG: methionyl-tRNA formyltransferase [Casimicrobiaceae bacterium]